MYLPCPEPPYTCRAVVPVHLPQSPASLPALLPCSCTCPAAMPVYLAQSSDRVPAKPSCECTCSKAVLICLRRRHHSSARPSSCIYASALYPATLSPFCSRSCDLTRCWNLEPADPRPRAVAVNVSLSSRCTPETLPQIRASPARPAWLLLRREPQHLASVSSSVSSSVNASVSLSASVNACNNPSVYASKNTSVNTSER